MASYKQLLKLIRSDAKPSRIREKMGLPPSRLRRMMAGKRFRTELKLEVELSAAAATYRQGVGAQRLARRLFELAESEKDETARKVCLALLTQGLQQAGQDDEPTYGLRIDELVAMGRLPSSALLYQSTATPDEQKRLVARTLRKGI